MAPFTHFVATRHQSLCLSTISNYERGPQCNLAADLGHIYINKSWNELFIKFKKENYDIKSIFIWTSLGPKKPPNYRVRPLYTANKYASDIRRSKWSLQYLSTRDQKSSQTVSNNDLVWRQQTLCDQSSHAVEHFQELQD